ncbi:MAG: hypothetical protein OXI73_06700 [Rhodospirillales bacterium]|nr:hypothetical protein [Rhodospirillales bacterium]
MTRTRPQEVRDEGTGAEKRMPRSIRFSDREWARLETVAVMRGMTAGELVRAAVLAAVGEPSGTADPGRSLVPLIELTFRYAYISATATRNRMQEDGRAEELAELIRSARELQRELQKGPAD